jgi:hypothetical protein
MTKAGAAKQDQNRTALFSANAGMAAFMKQIRAVL